MTQQTATSSPRRRVIVLSDAAALGDDGTAIAMLLSRPEIDVRLIAAVSGNVWAEQAQSNLRNLAGQLGRPEIPICLGQPAQALGARVAAFEQAVHSGLKPHYSGAFGTPLPPVAPDANDAACANLLAVIRREQPVDLVVIGPAGAAAQIIAADPAIKGAIRHVFLMGGAMAATGNATDAAEFNFWFDPESADAMLASGIPTTIVPLDAAGPSYPPALRKRLEVTRPEAAYLARRLDARPATRLWDEVLIAVMLEPQLVTRRSPARIIVNTSGGPDYGASRVTDRADRPVSDVILEVDEAGLMDLMEVCFCGRESGQR